MEFSYSYARSSEVASSASSTDMSFAPDTSREPTYFTGDLRQSVPFREAISALHDVVVSDLRWKPKDREAYTRWREQQEDKDLAEAAGIQADIASRVRTLHAELSELRRRSEGRLRPFYQARRGYFDYIYKVNRDAWFVLDPVITVHPDEIFFECFSQDESSYGRLGASYEVFHGIGEFACGTTNIDYSDALYREFQKIRSYKTTRLEVDASGFEVQTSHQEDFKEVKIDLPDSWVRGFLQVSSAMSLPATSFQLHPMDVHNFLFVLKRHKERQGPRSMRWKLTPGEPIRVVFEPWGLEVVCPRSIYEGEEEEEVRQWGRRRLLILERLIAVARSFTVHLLGKGLPSFWIADLGDLSFTLGLSGWTANDWSTAGNFDLMAPRADVDDLTKERVFAGLKDTWLADPDELARRLNLDRSQVLGALSAYTQAGRAMYDLNKGVYRARELSRDPLPMDALRFANEREEGATRFIASNAVNVQQANRSPHTGTTQLSGTVRDGRKAYSPRLVLDADERMSTAECTCNWHAMNKLFKGPCEHILALRMGFAQQRT